jgi:hypothetical protein
MSADTFAGLELATVLQVITTVAVVFGVAFGLGQLRQGIRNRRDQAAVDIVRAVQTPEIKMAIDHVYALPDDADPEAIRDDPSMLRAALAVDSACEMWGSMVFEEVIDLQTLDRMVGGWVRGGWRRLRRWEEDERVKNRNPNIAEWWQWLYEMLEADPDPGKSRGAHVAYRGRTRGRRN